MLKILSFIVITLPALAFGSSITEAEIVGDWEWLGNSMSQSKDLTGLTRTGPSIKRFHAGGKYEYISVHRDKQEKPVVGKWVFKSSVLSITRPDSGTYNNKVISFKNDVLETQDDFLGAYSYMKKK